MRRLIDNDPEPQRSDAPAAMVKIKSVEVKKIKAGCGFAIGLPYSWVSDVKLGPGDTVDIYRDVEDRLVIEKMRGD